MAGHVPKAPGRTIAVQRATGDTDSIAITDTANPAIHPRQPAIQFGGA